jgi:hypothetical protein
MLSFRLLIVAQQAATTAQSARELSQAAVHHSMASTTHGPVDVTLVALGVVVVILTTFYSVRYLIRPGETSVHHIKRRILEDAREGSR